MELTGIQEVDLKVVELRILRLAMRVTRMDRVRNRYIRKTASVDNLGVKLRESKPWWYGHMLSRVEELWRWSYQEEKKRMA